MSILPKLASSLERRDEAPNVELAQLIAKVGDQKAVKELVDNLDNKDKNIQSDCIKVLDEIAKLNNVLVAAYATTFVNLLDHKNNRLQWGAMAVLSAITPQNPKIIYGALSKIIAAADKGTVITRDHCVEILTTLAGLKPYADAAFALLNEQLLGSPPNQLPMYAENAIPIINEKNKPLFLKTLNARLDDIEKDTKRKRVEKVIKKLS